VKNNLEQLCRRLNYQFKNTKLLKQALTHCSMGSDNYERLEFLGDSILSFVIANELFHQFPMLTEGELSRLRSFLVKGEMLAEVAKEMDLGNHLFLGQGELKSGGFRRASILADSLEALFAAIFLDGGVAEAQKTILMLFRSRLDSADLSYSLKDPKTQLQEFLQANKHALPEYVLNKVEGDEHDQIFYVSCSVQGLSLTTTGKGSNRRKAEQRAARSLLEQLQSSTNR
jgi:ribonuclease-3